ncbi:MAG: hypothetical protein K2X72_09315 [Reyranella sp.]|nr:hypothetical protein [Reyranella sp.]
MPLDGSVLLWTLRFFVRFAGLTSRLLLLHLYLLMNNGRCGFWGPHSSLARGCLGLQPCRLCLEFLGVLKHCKPICRDRHARTGTAGDSRRPALCRRL